MDDGTDEWMEKASRPRRPLLYVMWWNKIVIARMTSYISSFVHLQRSSMVSKMSLIPHVVEQDCRCKVLLPFPYLICFLQLQRVWELDV
jgi:hypothetical protein